MRTIGKVVYMVDQVIMLLLLVVVIIVIVVVAYILGVMNYVVGINKIPGLIGWVFHKNPFLCMCVLIKPTNTAWVY